MKKKFVASFLLTCIGLFSLGFVSFGAEDVHQQVFDDSMGSQEPISLRLSFSPSEIETTVGEHGKLTVNDFNGVKLSGTFKEIKDNPYIELQSDGTWKVLKEGQTTIAPSFELSEESIIAIQQKYPNKKIIVQDIQQVIPINISDQESISLRLSFSPSEIETTVGEHGKLTVSDFEGIKLTGTFKEIKDDPYIKVNSDGSWIALKEGQTTIAPSFELSEESIIAIQQKYPNKKIMVQDIQQVIPINISDQESISLRLSFSPSEIETTVGEHGKLTVSDFEGIKLIGTFKEIKDDPYIKVNSDGSWIALKEGQTTIAPSFELSEESIIAIQQKYPNKKIMVQDIQQVIPINISDQESISLRLSFSPSEIETIVGEHGKLTVSDFEGIKLTGTFKEIKDDPYIKMNSDGSWIALKEGQTTIAPSFELSEESIIAIQQKHPNKKIMVQDIQQVIPINIKDNLQGKEGPKTSENNNIKTDTETSKKELPKTSESNTNIIRIIGLLIIVSIFLKKGVFFNEQK